MVKAIVIRNKNGELLAVSQVQELSTNEFVKLENEFLDKFQKDCDNNAKEKEKINEELSKLEHKIKSLEKQLAYDHGEIDSLED